MSVQPTPRETFKVDWLDYAIAAALVACVGAAIYGICLLGRLSSLYVTAGPAF